MSPRAYRLGLRQSEIDRTRSAILGAAREVVTEHGPAASIGKVAERAGVSRITVYNHFGSKERLLEALAAGVAPRSDGAPGAEAGSDPRAELSRRIGQSCTAWSADPSLYRRLEAHRGSDGKESEHSRALAERLAAHDQLRPGCSVKEAEDVIGILTSFAVFDRLHKGGRRSPSAVAEILMRMTSEFLAGSPSNQT
jgi:AcrR family transcriptional regulator